MAQQVNGYRLVPNGTFEQFRSYILTHAVNVDYAFGNQCMDVIMLLYYQYGFRLQAGPQGYAYEVWTNKRWQNSVGPFQSYTGAKNIKKGDVVVFNHHGAYYTGHIALANEDYKGGSTIQIVGQNQGQGSGWGAGSNIINYNISYFLGGFRNAKWQTTPPTPPTPTPKTYRKGKFPWAIYARKLRSR